MSIVFSPTTTTLSKGSTYTFQCQIIPNDYGTTGYMSIVFRDTSSNIMSDYTWDSGNISFFTTTQTLTQRVTVPQNASTATLSTYYYDENDEFVFDDITYRFPSPTVAPSNFKAAQDGKHIKFNWTAGSGEGTMSYLVLANGDDAPPGCSKTTGTESICSDGSSYYGKSIRWVLVYYLNDAATGSLVYQLNIETPSVSPSIGVTQASKAKQVTVSWNGSFIGITPTSKTFTVTCSGTEGNLYSGNSSGSMAYTPPSYGTTYRYTNTLTATNVYGDTFPAVVSKDFAAGAPYYAVGLFIDNQWKPCIVHVYQDGWKECYPHMFVDGKWKLCDCS